MQIECAFNSIYLHITKCDAFIVLIFLRKLKFNKLPSSLDDCSIRKVSGNFSLLSQRRYELNFYEM